jgi:hypothetical protein
MNLVVRIMVQRFKKKVGLVISDESSWQLAKETKRFMRSKVQKFKSSMRFARSSFKGSQNYRIIGLQGYRVSEFLSPVFERSRNHPDFRVQGFKGSRVQEFKRFAFNAKSDVRPLTSDL